MAETNGRGHTATIKYGTGYDAPWLVLTADTTAELQAEIEAATGVEAGELTLADHLAQAAIRTQGMWAAAQSLGATPLPATGTGRRAPARRAATKKTEAAPAPAPAEKPAEPEPAAAAPVQEADPSPFRAKADDPVHVGSTDVDPVIAALDAVTDMDGFRKVWQANQDAFKRPEIAAHAKATRARLDGNA